MSQKSLRIKLTWKIIVPLMIGMILICSVAIVPLYNEYPIWIDNYINDIHDDQGKAMIDVSLYLVKSESLNIIQHSANLMIIARALMNSYFGNSLAIKTQNYSPGLNYVSGIAIAENKAKLSCWNNITNTSYCQALWFTSPSDDNTANLNKTSLLNLNSSAVFDSFLRPMAVIGYKLNPLFGDVFIGFENDGLYYLNPAGNYSFLANASKNSLCSSPTYQYDPRCTLWFEETKSKSFETRNSVVLTDLNLDINSLSQSACVGIWSDSDDFILSSCLKFYLNSFRKRLWGVNVGKGSYIYVLDASGEVIVYSKSTWTSANPPSIFELEFGKNADSISAEVRYYRDHILPIFQKNKTELAYYYKNGDKMLISVAPIKIQLGLNSELTPWASVGIVIKESDTTKKLDKLKDDFYYLMYGEIAIFAVLIVFFGIWCYFLTKFLSAAVTKPVEKLSCILKRLFKKDLGVDIMEEYEPGPPEIGSLYEIFEKLRIVLKMQDSIKFNDETAGMINYAQALNLFRDFRNKKAMELCHRELGNIHFQNKRYPEAALNYYSSYRLSKNIEGISELEKARIKIQTAKSMLFAGTKKEEAIEMFNEAIDFYKSQSYKNIEIILCLLDKIESLFAVSQIPVSDIDEVEKLLQEWIPLSMQSILQQKYLYFRAFQYEMQEDLKTASRLYMICIEGFIDFDPNIRKKTLERLIGIFEKNSLPCYELKILWKNLNEISKDIALIIDTKICNLEVQNNILWLIEAVFNKNDRLSIIDFDEAIQIHFNLTQKIPKNIRFSIIDLINQSGKSVLYDGINAGINQICALDIKNSALLPSPNIQQKWVIAICGSGDKGSEIRQDFLSKKVNELGINLVIVYINYDPNQANELGLLINSSPRGVVISVYSDDDIRSAVQKTAAFMCPSKCVFNN
ncbi:unnamed protein product [Blepharisma stoltei]|uniref:Uncharacterized protein n=1 Tax=Blepharisma stoltei TaxID=1481888 RepID=A0AAU9IMD6_9CILI|nr:unnamed protein product [Blepharisma stoltei]